MKTEIADRDELPESESYAMTATLGMYLRYDSRGIFDYEADYYIQTETIESVWENFLAWLNDSEIKHVSDLQGDYAADWSTVVDLFDRWNSSR